LYFKFGHVATFAEHVVRQEMKSGVMMFTDWSEFTSEFKSIFCLSGDTGGSADASEYPHERLE
jgi:hypothetical protein